MAEAEGKHTALEAGTLREALLQVWLRWTEMTHILWLSNQIRRNRTQANHNKPDTGVCPERKERLNKQRNRGRNDGQL